MPKTVADDIRLNPIVATSQAEVARRFQEREDTHLLYHTLSHTREVAEAADRIACLSNFEPDDHEVLLVAAWWHDVGMLGCGDDPSSHEADSARQAREFLSEQGYSSERIDLVEQLILATNMGHTPSTELEKAIRDADLSGLGRPEYRERLKSLRKEWDAQGRLKAEDRVEWLEQNKAFFESHTYLTPAAERLYGNQKNLNKDIIEKRLKKRIKKKKKKAKKKGKSSSKTAIQSEKSAQMMLKTTLRNNIDLTSIADGKANIMLSINAAILTLGMPILAAYIPEFHYLVVPGGVLLITCVLAITYATLATRPVKTSGKTEMSKLGDGSTNLFFFGNYYNMPLPKYKEGLREVLSDQETLDESVMNDLYWLGVALGEKFNRLRICYFIFLVGMLLTALSFVVSFYWSGPLNDAVNIPDTIMTPEGARAPVSNGQSIIIPADSLRQ